ncbi:endonuclease/exonuclease/phosphatase family protein [Candidatus Roizmanbacteria bacterium]|nr:endonuclease/exonuclease/phosphatase family protein [Candidatus Roizmanbacteria bacterium]
MTLRLLQWNILFKENIEHIVQVIRQYQPDVINLQELSSGLEYNRGIDTASYIAEKISYNYFFQPGMVWSKDEAKVVGNGIFSKFPISKFSYSCTAQVEKRQRAEKYGSVYIEGELKLGSIPLTVATDHLMFISQFVETEEKIREVDTLTEIVKEKKRAYLFSGDLNAPPDSYTIRELKKYLTLCGPDVSQKTAFTKPLDDYAGWKTGFDWRLDYVFATNDIQVHSAQIIRTDYSDHLPIFIEFSF